MRAGARQWPLAAALVLAAATTSHAAAATPPQPKGGAAASDAASLAFLSVGDSGKLSEDLKAVAQQMGIWRAKTNSFATVLLGDNFYQNGVASVDDPLWQSTFVDVFPESQFPTPFYAIRGNHDYRTAPDTEIEYFQKHGEKGRWVMPAPGYFLVQKELADGTTVDFLYLDTITLAPKAAEKQVLLPPNVEEAKRTQYEWLEATLKASVARGSDWRIVLGHYPIYSAGEHGDTQELIDELLPVLERYQVDAYICGHDHTMQHLQHQGTGVQFLVNGSGSKLGTLDHTTQASNPRASQVYFGFMVHELTKERMVTRALDSTGRTQYVFSQAPRSKAGALKAGAGPALNPATAPAFHHQVPSKQQQQRGAASTTEGNAAFGDLSPASSGSSRGGLRVNVNVRTASPFVVAGGLLALLVIMAVVWRVRRRRRSQQRYTSVHGSSTSMAAASVGRGVWSDEELEEYESDLESGGDEFQVELPHVAEYE